MVKLVLLALLYFFIGAGCIAGCSSEEKKRDPGYITFVLLFWPLIVGILLMVTTICLIIAGIQHIFGIEKKDE